MIQRRSEDLKIVTHIGGNLLMTVYMFEKGAWVYVVSIWDLARCKYLLNEIYTDQIAAVQRHTEIVGSYRRAGLYG